MSVYAYFNEEIETDESFQIKSPDGTHTHPYLGEWQLGRHDGQYTVYLSGLKGVVPSVLAKYFTGISAIEWISGTPARENGVYEHKSATTEVETECTDSRNRTFKTKLSIRADKLEDAEELYQLIRTGDIRPTKSYEAPQGGLSRKELETQLAEANSRVKQLQLSQSDTEDLQRLRKWEGEAEAELRRHFTRERLVKQTIYDLMQGIWPFCLKRKLAQELQNALNV